MSLPFGICGMEYFVIKRVFCMCLVSFAFVAGAVELDDAEKRLLGKTAAEYRAEVYPPEVPRAFDVHREGCPVCGDGIKKHGMYSWILDPEKPFKVQCPECKTVFPDNDFAAFLKTGMKDRSLLTGKYVDDGRGWRPAAGEPKYWFVAYYNHWRFFRDKIHAQLANAYARTGEPAFARAALAMIDKYAEYYPSYDYNTQCRYAEEVEPRYTGRIVNMIWETFVTETFADAYLKVRGFLEQNDPELVQVTGRTCAEIRENIENNMFRVMADDITSCNGRISGNFGMHQLALLKVSKVLDDVSLARWVTDYRICGDVCNVPLYYALYNNMFGDGVPLESFSYNHGWITDIVHMFYELRKNGIDAMKEHPVSERTFNYAAKAYVCGAFTPSCGDSGAMQSFALYAGGADVRRKIFEMSPTPLNARLLKLSGVNDNEQANQLSEQLDEYFGYRSNLLASNGFATLQNGNKEAPTAIALTFFNYRNHRHADSLDLEIFAENASMLPDFGYPDSASGDDPWLCFYACTVSHNTVVVDGRTQAIALPSTRESVLHEYHPGSFAQRVSASVEEAYGIEQYRRNVMTCESAPGKTIVFDVFRIKGGSQHDWFIHGNSETFGGNVEFSEVSPGTLAGEDVAYGVFYDSPRHQAMMTGTGKSFGDYSGSGFQYLVNVRRGVSVPGSYVSLTAESRAPFKALPGAAINVYPLGSEEQLFLSQGFPQKTHRLPQKYVNFLSRRRVGEKGLHSVFATVFETVCDARRELAVARVESLGDEDNLAAARIVFRDGRILYVFDAEDSVSLEVDGIGFTGKAGAVLLDFPGGKGNAFVTGPGSVSYRGAELVKASEPFRARIVSVGLADDSVTFDADVPQSCEGGIFHVGDRAYQVASVNGPTVKLLDQSMCRGRLRFVDYSGEGHRKAVYSPTVATSHLRMKGLYSGEDRSVFAGAVQEMTGSAIECSSDVELGRDYWLSECIPGETALFDSSARCDFTLD